MMLRTSYVLFTGGRGGGGMAVAQERDPPGERAAVKGLPQCVAISPGDQNRLAGNVSVVRHLI